MKGKESRVKAGMSVKDVLRVIRANGLVAESGGKHFKITGENGKKEKLVLGSRGMVTKSLVHEVNVFIEKHGASSRNG
jgi:hypothetical protein